MKIKISIERVFFNMVISAHFLSAFLQLFFSGLSNKYVLIMLVITYVYWIKYVANIKSFLMTNLFLICYTMYNAVSFGAAQVMHSDYYTFVFFMLSLEVFMKKNVRLSFFDFFLKNYNRYITFTALFGVIMILSLIFGNGLRYNYDSVAPILYGPYDVQHQLGYILTGIYCAVSVYQYGGFSNVLLRLIKVLCVLCVVCTGVRSAFLGMLIVILADYFSMRNVSKKALVAVISILVVSYVVFFTDILYQIPIVQRTLYATSQGSITNGRERFADVLITYYKTATNFIEKFCGIGMTNLRDVMRNAHIGGIHAHNDYVNALVGYGLIGLLIYVVCQLRVLFSMNNRFYTVLLGALFFILSYYNGMAMYSLFTPSLLIVILFFDKDTLKILNAKEVNK